MPLPRCSLALISTFEILNFKIYDHILQDEAYKDNFYHLSFSKEKAHSINLTKVKRCSTEQILDKSCFMHGVRCVSRSIVAIMMESKEIGL